MNSRKGAAVGFSRRAFTAAALSLITSTALAATGKAFDHEPDGAGALSPEVVGHQVAMTETVPIRMLLIARDDSTWRNRIKEVGAKLPWVDLQASRFDPSPGGLSRALDTARRRDLVDVFAGIPGASVAALDAEGLLRPLNSLVGTLDLLPAMREVAMHHHAFTGLPLSGYPVYAMVNPRVLNRAGIDDPGGTYREWLETARQLTDRATSTYGWGVVADLPEIETITRSAGDPFWGSEGFSGNYAWQWYADVIHVHGVSPPPHAWDGLLGGHLALAEGHVAMIIRSGWVLDEREQAPDSARDLPELVPLPAWDDHPRVVPVRADYAAVASNSLVGPHAALVASALATDVWQAPGARGVPAWRPAIQHRAESWHVQPGKLTESSAGWRRPLLETPDAALAAPRLLRATDDVMGRGQSVSDCMQALALELDEIGGNGSD